jgi:hypothetical protein
MMVLPSSSANKVNVNQVHLSISYTNADADG